MKADTFDPFARTARARASHQRALDAWVEREGARAERAIAEHLEREARLIARAVAKGDDWRQVIDTGGWSVMMLREIYRPVFVDAARVTWVMGYERARKDIEDDVLAGWLERVQTLLTTKVARRITDITTATATTVDRIIGLLVAEGLDTRTLAKRLEAEVADVNRMRAKRIARTEVHAALNTGTMQGTRDTARALGLTGTKFWVPTPDEKTRWWHRDVAPVAVDEPFLVPNPKAGEDRMDAPGDFDAPASQVVNCRCGVVFQFDEP